MINNFFENKEQLEDKLKTIVLDYLKKVLKKKDSASILFSGGSTPIGLLKKLAEEDFNWENVKVGLVDDRMVDLEDEYSNARALRTVFVQNIKGNRPTFFPLVFNPKDESENTSEAINSVNSIGNPDIVLLGMGGDGHFASLFPNDKKSTLGLSKEYPESLIYTTAPDHPTNRISHSWEYLKKADKLILFATGKSKLNIIEKKEEREILPIDTLLNDTEIEPILYWAP
ncbi:MAG: 6-phosphogluconolactonase [Flavobacteriales bacterium]|nr:6-phosphogluconolactonase [Flavobacteriales bacterium]